MAHGPRSPGRPTNQSTPPGAHTQLKQSRLVDVDVVLFDFVISEPSGLILDLVALDLDPAHAAGVSGPWLWVPSESYAQTTNQPGQYLIPSSRDLDSSMSTGLYCIMRFRDEADNKAIS